MAKHRVVIIGGGFGGLSAFYALNQRLDMFQVTIVDAREESVEKPALPEVALAGKPVKNVLTPLQPTVTKRGGTFLHARVQSVDPAGQRVTMEDGGSVEYDTLIIASGAVKDYSAIPGFLEYGYSVCDEEMAVRLSEKLSSFRGGPVVTGAALTTFADYPGVENLTAPCEGPIGEIMFMLDHELRLRGLRDKSPITVFTPGEIFFEDVGPDVHKDFEPILEAHDLRVVTGKALAEIGADYVKFRDGSTLESALTVAIPPYTGPDFLKASELADRYGFIYTDETMRHPDHPNIYAIGDVNARTMPKLGHLAVIGAQVAASAIVHRVTGKGEILPFMPEIFCIMNRGGHDATLILSDYMYGGKRDLTYSGPLAHLMKWSFDTYYFYTRGHLPPDIMQKGLAKVLEFLHR